MSRNTEENEEWRKISNYSVYKSWGGQRNFMHSYGLKEYEPDDDDTKHQIVDGIKEGMWTSMSERERDDVRARYEKPSPGPKRQ